MASGLRCPAWMLLAGLVATVAPIQRAAAQDQGEPPPEAVEFYRSGREHFEAGRYREAIDDLERALTLDPGSATLVYNVARVHELLGELDPAIEYYARYLRLLPASETEERARVEETIGRLRGARTQVDGPITHQGPPPEVAAEDEPRWVTERGVVDTPFWVSAGASAVLLVAGTIAGVVALDRETLAEDFVVGSDGTIADRDDIADEADSLAVTADVLLLGGVAAGVTAALLYALRTRTVERFPEYEGAEPFVATDGTAAMVGVRGAL